jgi:Family of unknown function (DUF6152)
MRSARCIAMWLIVLAGLVQPVVSQAHHSGAMFDRERTVSITGIVKEFNWTNPHCSFKVEVAGSSSAGTIWAVEMNSPNNLVREGWKRTSLNVGDKVTAVVNPLRDGRPGGWYVAIRLADGTVLGTSESLKP